MTDNYRVRQTDCRTGWQVVTSTGRLYLTTRNRVRALEIAEDLNRADHTEQIPWLHATDDGAAITDRE